MKKATPEAKARTIACFNPAKNESSLIFPARIPPKNASSSDVCKNTLLVCVEFNIGLIRGTPLSANSLMGTKIILEIKMIMNKKRATEKEKIAT